MKIQTSRVEDEMVLQLEMLRVVFDYFGWITPVHHIKAAQTDILRMQGKAALNPVAIERIWSSRTGKHIRGKILQTRCAPKN